MTLPQSGEFSLPMRVYIEDTDAGGIVYYVNYLKYFERARTEYMRSLGYEKPAFPDESLMFVVSNASVSYRSPARLDESIRATACVTQMGGATLTFSQTVMRGTTCLVEGQVTLALVSNEHGNPRRIPAAMRQKIEGL
ncbi:tol-pal system-associated acyl-CoA thioesterase [Luminiphilus sp. nBUS_16]|uniref:tol-pal system-associated acyl-CoA thioesterase n=1 Tax=Luminiphilus sp. nBUS_16 TaxID=3395315 RepID=UPI003EBC5A09